MAICRPSFVRCIIRFIVPELHGHIDYTYFFQFPYEVIIVFRSGENTLKPCILKKQIIIIMEETA